MWPIEAVEHSYMCMDKSNIKNIKVSGSQGKQDSYSKRKIMRKLFVEYNFEKPS